MGYALPCAPIYAVREASRAWPGPGPHASRAASVGPCAADAEGAGPVTPDADVPDADGAGVDASDTDAVEELADEIATLAAHLHAGKRQLLALLARFDRLGGWEPGGHRSCAHWLAYRTGYDLGTAREHVRVARALEALPETGAAMGRGALSFSQVRALTRVATPDTEEDLLPIAEGATAAQLERLVRAWKRGSRQDEAARERELHRSRSWSLFPDEEGMYVPAGRLTPEVAAVLLRAVDAATDALYRQRPDGALVGADGRPRETHREAARRRADAIGLVAERALAAGLGSGEEESADDADGSCTCGRSEAPVSGARAERYQVMLFVDPGTLAADGEPGRSELEDGTRVSAETSRRLACDAGLVTIAEARDGPRGENRLLDVGRRARTVPPALRRALEARDRGCRFPGCGLRFTEAHHVVHWADGGETSLANTVLLCRYHHRLVHEAGWTVEWWRPGRPAFRDPRGSLHVPGRGAGAGSGGGTRRAPPGGGRDGSGTRLPTRPERTVAALERLNRLRGAEPDAWTAGARWKREADIPDRVLFAALEAAL